MSLSQESQSVIAHPAIVSQASPPDVIAAEVHRTELNVASLNVATANESVVQAPEVNLFGEMGLAEPIVRAVKKQGYTTPTPIQSQAIPIVMDGRDLLGCAQTGTGKTAAFALPILHRLTANGNPPRGAGRRIRALVLAPTRELTSQIHDSFRTYGKQTPLRTTMIYGGVNQQPQVRSLRNGVDIVIATPGRLCDLMNQGHVDLSHVEIFVLDEADRMFDMGFLPDLRRVIDRLPKERQTLFFSATMPPAIEQLANAILTKPAQVRIAPVRATTELIEQSVCFVPAANKPQVLAKLLSDESVTRTIVFTKTKHGADRVARQLNKEGIRAEAMHGNKGQGARQRILANFKSGRAEVLVATDVAARGIDVDGVSHVINYDLPHEAETYLHRIGRTGRAGATGVAIAFCDRDEQGYLRAIERLIRKSLTVDKEHPVSAIGGLVPAQRKGNDFQRRGNFAPRGRQGASRQGGRPQGGRSQNARPHGRRDEDVQYVVVREVIIPEGDSRSAGISQSGGRKTHTSQGGNQPQPSGHKPQRGNQQRPFKGARHKGRPASGHGRSS